MVEKIMTPRFCKSLHCPPHSYGDCIRACLATLLDRDDVPHVFKGGDWPECWAKLRTWLRGIDRTLFITDIDDPFEAMELNNPNVPFMLLCATEAGNHAVVCRGGKIIHDPAVSKKEIIGPTDLGVWIACVIGIQVD